MGEKITYPYGIRSEHNLNSLEIEMAAYILGSAPENGGLGKYRHLRNVIKMLWPKVVLTDWTDWRLERLCEYSFVSWAGAASSGKTHDAAVYAFAWWLCDPLHSTVVLTSTTKSMIKRRIWPVLQKLYFDTQGLPCQLVDSLTTIRASDPSQAKRKNEMSAIFAKAVAEGKSAKAAADIQGMHNKRILLVIDEGTDTPEAIFDVIPNLYAGATEFQVLVIGNPASRFDQHGRFSEPLAGWGSVDVDTDEWETVMQMNGKPGVCMRFDAAKSPNVIAGETKFSFLITEPQMRAAMAKLGENSPGWWKYYRGFWAPEGTTWTVLSETNIIKHDGMGKLAFKSWSHPVAFCDPAFGGDRCVLKFAKIGDLSDDRIGIQLGKTIEIHLNAKSKEPLADQVVSRVKSECELEGVPPDRFGFDASAGTGIALYSIFARDWSPRVRQIQFGGYPSDALIPGRDNKPAKDIYDRRVTELWFTVREFLEADQLKGLDYDSIKEFCARQYEDKFGKTRLEMKDVMKLRTKRSPDLADAIAGLVAVACELGAFVGTRRPAEANKDWDTLKQQVEEAEEARYEVEEPVLEYSSDY